MISWSKRRIVALVAMSSLVLAACAGPTGPRPTRFVDRSSTPGASGGQSRPAVADPPSASASPGESVAGSGTPALTSIRLEPFADGLSEPLFLTHAGDGSGILYAVEQGGRIQSLDAHGTVQPQPFLDIAERITAGGERGLLGLAFHPDYPDDGRIFVMYTAAGEGANTVSGFTVIDGLVDPASERVLVAIPDFAGNHNGGNVAFGPDGQLYVGTGDGGGGGDPQGNGQDPDALLGKILRLDVDAPGSAPQIWALGMRNPWRFSFDRETGDLWMADVGQGAWEEIDVEPAGSGGGRNYGWNVMEGPECLGGGGCDMTGLTLPVVAYTHDEGCTVVGGYVYRGAAHPELDGTYLYGDYCSGRFWALDAQAAIDGGGGHVVVLDGDVSVSSFGQDEQGEWYVTDISAGTVLRVLPAE
ncbi:PQQ-dependent sugar dehydrogenase [soil metagenome]